MGGVGHPPPRSAFTFTYTYNKITRLNCNYDLDFWLRFFLRNDQWIGLTNMKTSINERAINNLKSCAKFIVQENVYSNLTNLLTYDKYIVL